MSKELIDAASEFLQRLGFPIAVSLWFMFRAEKRLDRLATIGEKSLRVLGLIYAQLGGRDEPS